MQHLTAAGSFAIPDATERGRALPTGARDPSERSITVIDFDVGGTIRVERSEVPRICSRSRAATCRPHRIPPGDDRATGGAAIAATPAR
jgi:hypothetical protein